jgi:hypothetical protein
MFLELLRRSVQAVGVGRINSSFASDRATIPSGTPTSRLENASQSSVRVGPGSRGPRGPESSDDLLGALEITRLAPFDGHLGAAWWVVARFSGGRVVSPEAMGKPHFRTAFRYKSM